MGRLATHGVGRPQLDALAPRPSLEGSPAVLRGEAGVSGGGWLCSRMWGRVRCRLVTWMRLRPRGLCVEVQAWEHYLHATFYS